MTTVKKRASFKDFDSFSEALKKLEAKEEVSALSFHGDIIKDETLGETAYHLHWDENETL